MNAMTTHRRDRRARFGLMAQGAATITLDQKIERIHRDDLAEIQKDWERIGKDMHKVMPKAKRERAAA